MNNYVLTIGHDGSSSVNSVYIDKLLKNKNMCVYERPDYSKMTIEELVIEGQKSIQMSKLCVGVFDFTNCGYNYFDEQLYEGMYVTIAMSVALSKNCFCYVSAKENECFNRFINNPNNYFFRHPLVKIYHHNELEQLLDDVEQKYLE